MGGACVTAKVAEAFRGFREFVKRGFVLRGEVNGTFG